MEDRNVVICASRQPIPQKESYPIHDFELAVADIHLKLWRYHLYGVKFEVYSDHKSLKYLLDKRNLNIR